MYTRSKSFISAADSTRQQRIEAAVGSREHGQHKQYHIGLPVLVLYCNSTAFVVKDADEDEGKGCVDAKTERQAWINPDRQGNDPSFRRALA